MRPKIDKQLIMNPFQRSSKVAWRTRRLDREMDIDSNGLVFIWLRG